MAKDHGAHAKARDRKSLPPYGVWAHPDRKYVVRVIADSLLTEKQKAHSDLGVEEIEVEDKGKLYTARCPVGGIGWLEAQSERRIEWRLAGNSDTICVRWYLEKGKKVYRQIEPLPPGQTKWG